LVALDPAFAGMTIEGDGIPQKLRPRRPPPDRIRRRSMRKLYPVAVLAGALCVSVLARAGETVRVAPQGFIVTMILGKEPLQGYLARPAAAGRRPAVVELHGCAGSDKADAETADRLQAFGYVALALDSLGAFNACGNGANGGLAEAYDAYLALDWLARQSFVDPDRVAVLGFDMGGDAALDSVERGSVERSEKRHFRAAVAYYPECAGRPGVVTQPTLILIGDKDDWASAFWCRDMVAGRDGRGAPITLVVYPGAAHAFDVAAPRRQYLGHVLDYDAKAAAGAWQQVGRFLHGALEGQR
jgi:dienelactone hydrolase